MPWTVSATGHHDCLLQGPTPVCYRFASKPWCQSGQPLWINFSTEVLSPLCVACRGQDVFCCGCLDQSGPPGSHLTSKPCFLGSAAEQLKASVWALVWGAPCQAEDSSGDPGKGSAMSPVLGCCLFLRTHQLVNTMPSFWTLKINIIWPYLFHLIKFLKNCSSS